MLIVGGMFSTVEIVPGRLFLTVSWFLSRMVDVASGNDGDEEERVEDVSLSPFSGKDATVIEGES